MKDIIFVVVGILILVWFYGVYIAKMLLQKKKGIQTNQIAKKKTKTKVYYVERLMQLATFSVVIAEVVSIFVKHMDIPLFCKFLGIGIGIIGDIIFTTAVFTMRDSWRAGIPEEDRTEMVTGGIYRISRNPAFLGFDCVYIGMLLLFFNIPLLILTVFAIVMLHLQILQEEQFLPTVFGEEYANYKKKVCRYIGRRA